MIGWTPGQTLEMVEKEAILQAYEYYSRNKTRTAEALGMAARTLDYKMQQYAQEEEAAKLARDAQDEKDREFDRRARGLDHVQEEPKFVPPPVVDKQEPQQRRKRA